MSILGYKRPAGRDFRIGGEQDRGERDILTVALNLDVKIPMLGDELLQLLDQPLPPRNSRRNFSVHHSSRAGSIDS